VEQLSLEGTQVRYPAALTILLALPSLPGRAVHAQQTPAPILEKGLDNAAAGLPSRWEFGATDITIKEALAELWVLDSFTGTVPTILAFSLADLTAAPRPIAIELPPQNAGSAVLGIAEIPHGEFRGKNLLLIDANFGTVDTPLPLLGIYGDDGKIDPANPFFAVNGVDATAFLGPIDVSPTEEEIAVYDSRADTFYILDFGFSLKAGPFPLLGDPTFFAGPWDFGSPRAAGVGIAFNGPDRLLVTSAFRTLFECRFALEYDPATGLYSGNAMDLSAAADTTPPRDLAFVSLDVGKAGADDALFAVNFADESLYAFQLLPGDHPPPVEAGCSVAPGDVYSVSWTLASGLSVDAFHVFENGVEVAVLGPLETTYTFPLPLVGKSFIEVATEKNGVVSAIRTLCQVENTRRPAIENVVFDGTEIANLGSLLLGIAVTKLPATKEDFRVHVLGRDSNVIESFDYKLDVVELINLSPRVSLQGTNLPSLGLAIADLDGAPHFAVLDPDGPTGNEIPSASFHPVSGPTRGATVRRVETIDLTSLSPAPFLLDWDVADASTFIAAGIVNDLTGLPDYVIVKIAFDGQNMTGTRMVPIPHRLLTPFGDTVLSGIGVTVLPSGNLLVAGSDTFSRTYTDALLTTPFTDDPATAVKITGYAQGLVALNQFFGVGAGYGPREFYGFDAAYFPPAIEGEPGVGVTYLTANDVFVLDNPSGSRLRLGFPALVHSDNACSHPDLVAEHLAEEVLDVPASQEVSTPVWSPEFSTGSTPADYFVYVANTSPDAAASLALEVLLGGSPVAEASQDVVIEPGRYFRRMLGGRSEGEIQLRVRNRGTAAVQVKVIAGAMAVGATTMEPVFKRGDCDGNGTEAITDAIFGLNWLFQGGTAPGCQDACDADDNGDPNLTDMVLLLNHLFRSGDPPAPPGPDACGIDPTGDDFLDPCDFPGDACQ
jgi:hypothetical protein